MIHNALISVPSASPVPETSAKHSAGSFSRSGDMQTNFNDALSHVRERVEAMMSEQGDLPFSAIANAGSDAELNTDFTESDLLDEPDSAAGYVAQWLLTTLAARPSFSVQSELRPQTVQTANLQINPQLVSDTEISALDERLQTDVKSSELLKETLFQMNSMAQSQSAAGTAAFTLAAVSDRLGSKFSMTDNPAATAAGLFSGDSPLLNSLNDMQSTTTLVRESYLSRAPFGAPEWQSEFNQHMMNLTLRGNGNVSLHLNPRDLGPLMIDLKVIENQAQLHFQSQQQSVRTAVENALPELRELLESQGISLGDASVSKDSNNNSANFQFGDQRDSSSGNGRNHDVHTADLPAVHELSTEISTQLQAFNGRVNLYI